MTIPEPAARHRRVPLMAGGIVFLMVVGLAGWWGARSWEIRQVTHHPVVSILESQGWPRDIDRIERAGWLDRLFLGGMIEHSTQRQILYRFDVDDPEALRSRVEQQLFGSVDRPSPFVAHGLRWERRVRQVGASYDGHPIGDRGRLERVTVSVDDSGVAVRTFGR